MITSSPFFEKKEKQIFKKLELIHTPNKKWMSKDQYEWFINYKLCRENSDEVNFEAQFLIKNIPEISTKKILDVGCGTGDMAINMMRQGLDITGVDMSKQDIEIAKLKADKYNLCSDRFKIQDCSQIPYPDECFDVVLCIEVLEHTGVDYMNVLKEIFRVLKIGGILYLTIPNKLCPYDTHLYTWIPHWLPKFIRVPYLKKIRGEKAKSENYLLDYNFFTPKQIEKILKFFSKNINVNKMFFNYKFNNLKAGSSTGFKSIAKTIIIKLYRLKFFNYCMLNLLGTFYFFQSIKIVAVKN